MSEPRTVSIKLTQTPEGLSFETMGGPSLAEVVGLCEYGALIAKSHMINSTRLDQPVPAAGVERESA